MLEQKKIIHIDLDAFFPSVEILDNPALRGKPIIVGGTAEQRGVVSSASYEARRFGVHSAMPTKRAQILCPELIVLPPRFERYQEISQQMHETMQRFTDLIEPLSLDECYLDVSENKVGEPSASRLAKIIKDEIFSKTGLTASAGVAPLKFLAKIASDMQKPNGLTVITPAQVNIFLVDLPVGKLWGVGKVTEQKLEKLGIRKAGDLAPLTDEFIYHHFGKFGLFIRNLARGIDPRSVELPGERQQIGREVTFDNDVMSFSVLEKTLVELVGEVAQHLKKSNKVGRTLSLKVRYWNFETHSKSRTLSNETDNPEFLLECARQILTSLSLPTQGVRLLGFSISHLCTKGAINSLWPDWEDYSSHL